ncbi:sigma factor G inhibitor Gin [Alkaliphilus crotonatoxidans]
MKDRLQCHICNQYETGGIFIKNKYICGKCEAEIVKTTPEHINYDEIKDRIKEALFQ